MPNRFTDDETESQPMLDTLTGPFAQRLAGSLVRRGLDVVGGYLVARGLLNEADAAEFALALTPVVVSLAWSIYQKRQQQKREDVALRLPMGSDTAAIDRVMAKDPAP